MNISAPTLPRLCLLALVTLLPNLSQAASGGPDGYGYTWNDSIAYQWIDITTTGQVVISNGDDTTSNDPVDGIGGPVPLGFPFTLYGETVTSLVPTTNGYLSTDPDEKGFDNTSDCPLPKAPSDGGGSRIYAFHRNLNFNQTDSKVYYQYFDESPHAHANCGVSVFTWQNAAPGTSPTVRLSFQALLFDNGDIIVNYDTGGFNIATPATIGIQSDGGQPDGIAAVCSDTAGSIAGQDAILFEPPFVEVLGATQSALQAALNAVPAGGKIRFQGVGSTVHHYDALFTISKPVAIESATSPFDARGLRFVVNSKLVMRSAVLRSSPGDLFSLGNSRTLKLCGCTITDAGESAIEATSNARVDVVGSSIEAPALGSEEPIRLGANPKLRIIRSVIADARGDAIHVIHTGVPPTQPNVVIDRSSIVNNRGAGIFADSVRLKVINSTLSNNQGAAISAVGSDVRVLHSTVVENFTAMELDDSDAEVGHSILASNRDPGASVVTEIALTNGATVTSLGRNIVGAPAGIFGAPTNDLVNTDPKLTPLGIYGGFVGVRGYSAQFAHLPLAGSPAINAGGFSSPETPSTDQRGYPRRADGANTGSVTFDIGSVEMGPFVLVDTFVDENNGPAGFGVSLREAGALASDSGAIRFDSSLDGTTIDINLFGGAGAKTIVTKGFVDASNLPNGITITGDSIGDAHLFGGPFAHGVTFASGKSRAVRNDTSGIRCFSDCRFIGNKPDFGNGAPAYDTWGGAILDAGLLHLNGCRFVGNRSQAAAPGRGGAIANLKVTGVGTAWGIAHIVGCHFEGNGSDFTGGAVYSGLGAARCRIDRCSFIRNSAAGSGAASVSVDPLALAPAEITRSTFHANDAGDGSSVAGAVSFSGAGWTHRLHYCTLHENTANNAGADGGAVHVNAGTLDVDHCAITNNQAETGGGIAVAGSAALTIRNTILDNNYGTYNGILTLENLRMDGGASAVSLGGNLSQDFIPQFSHPTDLVGLDPQLGPLQNNGGPTMTRHPLSGSPAIDAGASPACPTDQRGQSGRFGISADIGPVEVGAVFKVRTSEDKLDVVSGFDVSLREALRDVPDGGRIVFEPGPLFAGNEINLSTGLNTTLTISKNVTVDATAFPGGITIRGPSNARVLNITSGDFIVGIHGVSFTGGNAGLRGGGIRKASGVNLTLTQSAVFANHAAGDGGGIRVEAGELVLRNVTLSGNTTDATGGGLSAPPGAVIRLSHCPIADHTGSSGAAGIDLDADSQLEINYTVLGQNLLVPSTALVNYDAEPTAFTSSRGKNMTDDVRQPWFVGTDRTVNLLIGGLSDLGGLARVHPPLPLSPIVNAGLPNQIIDVRSDARGLPRIYGGSIDIGAMEMGGEGRDRDLDGIPDEWEVYYGLNENDPNDAGLDLDGDGQTALQEHLAHTIPNFSGSVLKSRALASTYNPTTGAVTSIQLDWSSVPGVVYEIWHSLDLGATDPWEKLTTVPGKFDGEITEALFDSPGLFASPQGYFQIRIAP